MSGCGGTDPDWPETLFARAVHRALERILAYVGDPGLVEEADAAWAAWEWQSIDWSRHGTYLN